MKGSIVKILTVLFCVLLISTVLPAVFTDNANAQIGKMPVLYIESEMIHQRVIQGETAVSKMTLTNVGKQPISIMDIERECDDTAYVHYEVQEGLGVDIESIAVGDADNDGDNEVVVGTDSDNIFMYDGSGSSWTRTTIDLNIGGTPHCLDIGDPDNDNENEVIVGTGSEDLFLYEYNSTTWDKIDVDTNIGGEVLCCEVGDVDNNGVNEIVIGTSDEELAKYVVSRLHTSWSKDVIDSSVGGKVESLSIGDADDDGDNEIVVGMDDAPSNMAGSSGEVYMYKRGYSSWTKYTIYTGDGGIVEIGDSDDDGSTEVVLAGYHETSAFIGSTSSWSQYIIKDYDPYSARDVVIGDPDDDGVIDVVVALNDGRIFKYTYDTTYQSWTEEMIYMNHCPMNCMALGDADDDGKNEVVCGDGYGGIFTSEYSSLAQSMICWLAYPLPYPVFPEEDDEIQVMPLNEVPQVPHMMTFSAEVKGKYKSSSGDFYDYPDSDMLLELGYSPFPSKVYVTVITDLSGLKKDSITKLENSMTGDKKTDAKLQNAIDRIEDSLDDKLWEDNRHLDPKHGKNVFRPEKAAVKELSDLILYARNNPDADQDVMDSCKMVIGVLTSVDRMLASLAFTEAQDHIDNLQEKKMLEQCKKHLMDGEFELSKHKYLKAIDSFRHAWGLAQKVMK